MKRSMRRRLTAVALLACSPLAFAGCMGYPAQVPADQQSAPTMAAPSSPGESRLPGLLAQLQSGGTGVELFDGSQNAVLAAQDVQDKPATGATTTPTPRATATRTPTGSLPLNQPTATRTPAATPTPSANTEAEPTAQPTATPTATPAASSTATPTPTATPTQASSTPPSGTPPSEGNTAPTRTPPTEG